MKTTSKTLKILDNKVALVTGSSSGIGRAAALEFARRGAKVVASARRRPEIDSLVAQIKSEGLEATAIVADVNVEKDVIDLVSATTKTYGRFDIAFNNAGTEGEFTPFLEQSNQVYDTIFNANVRGVFWSMGINVAQRIMDCGDTGHILLSKRVAEDLQDRKSTRLNSSH